jgi:hypothetical protein
MKLSGGVSRQIAARTKKSRIGGGEAITTIFTKRT